MLIKQKVRGKKQRKLYLKKKAASDLQCRCKHIYFIFSPFKILHLFSGINASSFFPWLVYSSNHLYWRFFHFLKLNFSFIFSNLLANKVATDFIIFFPCSSHILCNITSVLPFSDVCYDSGVPLCSPAASLK